MKTFKEFICEEDDEKAKTVSRLSDLIEKECKGFLARAGRNGLLYRGVSGRGDFEGRFAVMDDDVAVYRKKVRKDRSPMSTNEVVSRAVDEWFEEALGFRARSQAIFCFGEGGRSSAQGYGSKQTMLFPVGKFSFAWSPNVDDLYGKLDIDMIKRGKPSPEFLSPSGKMDPEKVAAYMKTLGYTNNHLEKAILTDSEIMIDCDEVLLVPYDSISDIKRVHQELGTKYKPTYFDE